MARATNRPRRSPWALALAMAAPLLLDCARRASDPRWVDTTPAGFVAAPVDPLVDGGPEGDGGIASPDTGPGL